mmetsp:Transcript_27677/g.110844  ORF Transcript_27677/g.110844 Transcript_27677/m.110844 type:complete len:237 (-) Transcript_27677:36-746(-)
MRCSSCVDAQWTWVFCRFEGQQDESTVGTLVMRGRDGIRRRERRRASKNRCNKQSLWCTARMLREHPGTLYRAMYYFRRASLAMVSAKDARFGGEKSGELGAALVESSDSDDKHGVLAHIAECHLRLWSVVRCRYLHSLRSITKGFVKAAQDGENTRHHVGINHTNVPYCALGHPWPEPGQNLERGVGVRCRGGFVDLRNEHLGVVAIQTSNRFLPQAIGHIELVAMSHEVGHGSK